MKYAVILGISSLIMFINYTDSLSGGINLNNKEEKETVFYFEMTRHETEEFLRKVSLLKVGYKYEKIIEILGKPRFDQKMYGKNIDPKTKHPSFKFRALDYYVKVYEKDFANEHHDVYISIMLDNEDNLFKIVYYPDSWKEQFLDEMQSARKLN